MTVGMRAFFVCVLICGLFWWGLIELMECMFGASCSEAKPAPRLAAPDLNYSRLADPMHLRHLPGPEPAFQGEDAADLGDGQLGSRVEAALRSTVFGHMIPSETWLP